MSSNAAPSRLPLPPELEFAKAGCIDEQSTSRQHNQLPVSRRVTALVIALAHGPGALEVVADQTVHERRLADAGGAQQGDGPARSQVRLDRVQLRVALRAHRHNGSAASGCLDLVHHRVHVVAQVGLVEDDDRAGPAFVRGGQVPFQPAQAEVGVQPHHQEHRIDVCRDDLLVGLVARDFAGELAAPRQDGMDDGPSARDERPEHDPVANGRELPPRDNPVAEAASHGGQQVRMARVHRVDMLVLEGDAAGHEPFRRELLEIRGESPVPAKRVKLHDPEGSTAARATLAGRDLGASQWRPN